MANLTRIKILTTASTAAAPSNIYTGELVYSYQGGSQANNGDRLYIGTGNESPYASTVAVVGGKYFTDMLDHVHGTTTAASALITDANFGDYSWDNESAAVELQLTVQPDYCILNF